MTGDSSIDDQVSSEDSEDEQPTGLHLQGSADDEIPICSPMSDSSVSKSISSLSSDDVSICMESVSSVDHSEHSAEEITDSFSFIMVGDNLDQTIKPR